MAVVCETCGTSNRDAAQYCRGCSGKLPAFYAVPGRATAPASLRAARPPDTEPTRRTLRIKVTPTGLWLTGGLVLALVLAVGLMWYLGQSAAARIRAGASVGTAQAATPSGATAPRTGNTQPSQTSQTPSVPSQRSERDAAALAAADAALALLSKPPERAAPDKPWVASTPPDRTAAARASAPVPARVLGRDPTAQCAELNFFSRAICVNNVCADPAFASHPQCQTARLQRKQDEARRNASN
ncbi:hypothetical protein BH11PSE13_BH11PSE13_13330 [soil metagenome]